MSDKYKIEAKLFIDFLYEHETPDSSMDFTISVDDTLQLDEAQVQICSDKNSSKDILVEAVVETGDDIEKYANNMLRKLCWIVTFRINHRNENIHLGHPAVSYLPRFVKINKLNCSSSAKVEKDNLSDDTRVVSISSSIHIHNSVHTKLTRSLDLNNVGYFCNLIDIAREENAEYLFDLYYNALRPGSARTKFYNAYSIVEWFENEYQNDAEKLLTQESINELKQQLNNCLHEMDVLGSKDHLQRVTNIIDSTLKKMTIDNRKTRMRNILEKLNVKVIHYFSRTFQAEEVLLAAGKIRNTLFHGGSPSAELKELTDKLIMVTGEMLLKRFSKKENGNDEHIGS